MYKNPVPVVVCLARLWDNRLVGIRRGIEPAFGALVFPGGYVDEGERLEDALAREFKEECGFSSEAGEWSLWTSRITPNNRVLIFGVLQRCVTSEEWEYMQAFKNGEVQGFEVIDQSSVLGFPLHDEVRRLHFKI